MTRRRTVGWLVAAGVLASLVMAGVIAFYASEHPDGLESVAQEQGFLGTAQDSPVAGSPLADYGVAAVADERWSAGLAGIAGVALTAAVGFGLFLLLRGRRTERAPASGAAPAAHG